MITPTKYLPFSSILMQIYSSAINTMLKTSKTVAGEGAFLGVLFGLTTD